MIHRIQLVALCAAALTATEVAAQSPYVGARLGASFATFAGPGAGDMDAHRSGWVGGALAGLRLHDRLAVQTEVTWIQKGAKGTLQGFEEPLASDLELNYVQIPLLLRLTLPSPLAVHPVLIAGGAVSLEAGCESTTAEGELALTYGCAGVESPEKLSRTDWSVLAGVGLEYDVGRISIGLEARYDVGLVDVGDVAGLENRAGIVTAAVSVPLGR